MDMKINKDFLRRERELRAWTQSHLAEIAGLSMRTVQRIERTGNASMESASALAAALNLELGSLMEARAQDNKQASTKLPRYKFWGAFGLLGFAAIASGWWSTATAEQVMISLSIATTENTYSNMTLLNEIGSESEMKLDDRFRMLLRTSRENESLFISTKIYSFANGQYQLLSSPAMLVADQKPASMRLALPDGQEINLQLVADF